MPSSSSQKTLPPPRRHLRPLLLLLAAIVGISLLLFDLGIISQFTSSEKTTTSRTSKEVADGRTKKDNTIRVIALCACGKLRPSLDPEDFNDAFRKISSWLPQIWYAGVFQCFEESTPNKQCEDQIEKWMTSELQRRQMVITPNITSVFEVIYYPIEEGKHPVKPLNETLVGRSKILPVWEGGMHVPFQPTHFQRFIKDWGEVANSKELKCSFQDYSTIHAYRSRQLWSIAQEENCAVVHLPAVMRFARTFLKYKIENGLSPANETLPSFLSHQLTRDQARQSLSSKSQFVILITMTTFQPRYSTDALVRHALCRLLTKQYKPCVAVASWKGQAHNITIEKGIHKTHEAMKDYKFAITMPNHFQDGYIAEKTLNPYLASSVAITSIPNIGKYANAAGMVACRVPEEELRKVQMYYKGNFKWMPFNTTPEMWQSSEIQTVKYDPYANNNRGDEPVLEFVESQWEKALQPCIEEIIRLDQDDNAYIEKLMQPYLLHEGHNSMFDGSYVAMSMLLWFQWANSPLVRGLEDNIHSLHHGMLEQTSGGGAMVKEFAGGATSLQSKAKNEVEMSPLQAPQNSQQEFPKAKETPPPQSAPGPPPLDDEAKDLCNRAHARLQKLISRSLARVLLHAKSGPLASQMYQDATIISALGKSIIRGGGIYADVAAAHPRLLSNTYVLDQ